MGELDLHQHESERLAAQDRDGQAEGPPRRPGRALDNAVAIEHSDDAPHAGLSAMLPAQSGRQGVSSNTAVCLYRTCVCGALMKAQRPESDGPDQQDRSSGLLHESSGGAE